MASHDIANVRYIVDDVAAAVDFYTKHLGFEVNTQFPPAFADVIRGNLRVLLSGRSSQRVAPISEVYVDALMLEMRDLAIANRDELSGPLALLAAYDAQHNAHLVETLRAWLDAFGDVIAASASVYVHPNTFRYRLRRVAEVGRIDLQDPSARFAAMVQLRLMTIADRSSAE